MAAKRSIRILTSFIVSLVVTVSLLVFWVVYIVTSSSRITELAHRVGVSSGNTHWIVLAIGCVLFTVLLLGLTYQLALTFAERRYSRKQDEFVSNITHELKSPLAAIKLHAQTLQQGGLAEAEHERSVSFVLEQADRMAELVDNVLESSRLRARRKRLDLVPVEVRTFLTAYLEAARSRLRDQGLDLAAEIETGATVMATTEALQRIMDNLLDNAARFSARHGEIRCRVRDAGEEVAITVEDDGVGIPKKELTKIFDRFYRIGREIRGRRAGTGLGLSIVAGLVREMKGTVQAFSHEGRPGARFEIRLPRLPARDPEAS